MENTASVRVTSRDDGYIRNPNARRADLDSLLREHDDRKLVALIPKLANHVSLNRAMRLLTKIPLDDLPVNEFPIRMKAPL